MPVYFSVIVPIYKVETYIRACVDSILAQTFRDFELILVDDGSPDGCPAICDEYAARDGRVAVVHQKNAGVVAARAAGISRARADYLCFVDGDDRVAPDWLETIRRRAEENGRPDVVMFGCVQEYGDRSEPFALKPAPGLYTRADMEEKIWPYMLYDRRRPFFRRLLPSCFWFSAWNSALLRAHYMEPAWWPLIREYEDVCVTYECIRHASSLYICPELLYLYNCANPASATTAYFPGHARNLAACIRYFRAHLGAQAPELRPQINAHMSLRAISCVVQEYNGGHSVPEALRNVRRAMNEAGLPALLSCRGLPLYVAVFILCLKLRLFLPAVLAVKLRMNAGSTSDFA